MRRALALALAAAVVLAAAAARAEAPAYDVTVATRIQPQAEQLLVRLAQDGRGLVMDGVPVFNGDDKFLPGKIALGLADFLTTVKPDDPRRAAYLADFRKIAKLTVDDANDSWGIYYYLSALNALRQAGVLKEAVDPLTLAKLRVRLDWRTFVDVDTFTLIDHPNNYYGVAFAIARLRAEMGWEDGAAAERLFAKAMAHYEAYSAYGFADETDGEGRFDRYSVLLAGELSQRFLETGGQPPPALIDHLKRSAELMLLRLSHDGQGFEYGRSLGPYGETAVIEVLTAAARLGLLDARQKDMAYAFSARAAQRYVDFWVSPQTGSVDLWGRGRRTDGYRGKFRILGENLSLAHQYVYTSRAWAEMGYAGAAPMADYDAAIDALPRQAFTWFARGTYDRALLTLRDRGRVIGLPIVNGGASQHMHNAYFPIPYSPGMLSGVADGTAPLLTPQFTLADGSVLAPLAFFRDVAVSGRGATTTVTWRLSEMDRLGGAAPVADTRLSVRTTYVFSPGHIQRTDVYTPVGPLPVKGIALAFGSYSEGAELKGKVVRFGKGAVTRFSANGFDGCSLSPPAAEDRTPIGAFASRVDCASGPRTLSGPITLSWSIDYD